jgi:hypothetical protein
MSDTSKTYNIGFLNTLTIVFVVLKLCKVITWSWWLVLAPTWIPWAALGIILFIVFAVTLFVEEK